MLFLRPVRSLRCLHFTALHASPRKLTYYNVYGFGVLSCSWLDNDALSRAVGNGCVDRYDVYRYRG